MEQYKRKFEENDDEKHIKNEIESVLHHNKGSEYPFSIQVVGEKSKTKYMNIPLETLEKFIKLLK